MINNYDSLDPLVVDGFSFVPATVEEITQAIHDIRSNAFGSDGVTRTMIQYCSPFIYPFVTHIVNVCLERSYFPIAWKTSIIKPIPKVTDPGSYSDLRPISLLPVLSKILEKIIYFQINKYVNDNKLIPDAQSGFRKNFSTSTALSGVLDTIVRDLDAGKMSALVLLDFSKAFDTISHDLLCSKLRYYGFRWSAVGLISAYLSNRSQRVVLNGETSLSKPVISGVPQGSILGPLLFILYTADILKGIECCSYQAYADDTQLSYSFFPTEHHIGEFVINRELRNISESSKKHNLILNPDKSVVLLLGGRKMHNVDRALQLHINGTPLPVRNVAKSLGVLIDSNLRFVDQVNRTTQKAFHSLKMLYANKHILSKRLKKMLVESLVLSHFNYCSFVYGPFLNVLEKKKIQRVQNSCCRFVCSLRKYDHITDSLRQLKWIGMSGRRDLLFAGFIHKIMVSGTPSFLYNLLVPRSSTHHRDTRYKGLFTIPKHSTALFRKCFSYQAAHTYNKLSNELKLLSPRVFKTRYRRILLESQ